MKQNKKLTMINLGIFGLFLIIAVCVCLGVTQSLDEALLAFIPRTEWMTTVMKGITFLGEGLTMTLLGVLVILFIKDKRRGVSLLGGLALVAGLNSGLKLIIRRPRPLMEHLIAESGFSFPSGHSASSMAFYGYLIYLVYTKCQNKTLKYSLIIFLVLIILGIGISRMYLGVHYPSDVLGGFTFGLSMIFIYIRFTDWIWSK